jgi:hypothetical protein
MASFDLETFLKVQGQTGTGAIQALGMSYGMPSCMLNLAQKALSLLPSSVLSDVKSQMGAGKAKANEVTKEVFKKMMLNTGIIEFDTGNGTFKFGSDSAWMGMDNDDSQTKNNLAGLLGAFQYASSFGAQLYQNYTDIKNEIDAIKGCLDKFNKLQKFQSGNSADQKATLSEDEINELFDTVYAGDKAKLEAAGNFVKAVDAKISDINDILAARAKDPSLEPKFLDSSELDQFLSGTNFTRTGQDDPGLEDEDPVFRLTYGPPLTTGGLYVLTNDGLYYDSYEGGLDPVYLAISGMVPVGDAWKYDYDPNLGGKGQAISLDALDKFTDNIFDPKKIDDSVGLQHYYDQDHFLAVLKQQRDKHVYDLSSDLTNFISDYGADSSIVSNQRNLIMSEIANHNTKINRRKKQIEVAVKAGQIYGDLKGPQFAPGEIPINDFSYLEKYNLSVDLEKQKALVFEHADVNGIVLPIETKFVKPAHEKPQSLAFNQLKVPTVGKGSILYSPSGGTGTVLSLTDQIVSDGLFAIYNFLDTSLELPSSTNFNVTNCSTENMYNNAQLVGTSKQSIFVSGLAIPFLEGIVKNKSSDPAGASALGSYLKLPDNPEFSDLTYSSTGFTVECWAHVPNITDGELGWASGVNLATPSPSSLTKVLFGCENVGQNPNASAIDHTGAERDLDFLKNQRGGEFVRGMLCGFSRDRRITQVSGGYSNNNHLNSPTSSLSFFIAPTQARDLSSASFINNDDCQDYETFHKMKVDLSATDFGNVSSQFVLIDVACDIDKNEVRMYADGSLVATSSITAVFGVDEKIGPSLPSFKKDNSFQYSSTTVDGPSTIKQGPLLNPFYTPWIVGGGYTDGMYQYGNFMGGDRGGYVSGLRGHIGSLKFYSRALDNGDVKKNYDAQQGFFKNIRI